MPSYIENSRAPPPLPRTHTHRHRETYTHTNIHKYVFILAIPTLTTGMVHGKISALNVATNFSLEDFELGHKAPLSLAWC